MAIAGCAESKREQESTQPPAAITGESTGVSSYKTNEPPIEKLKYNDIEKKEFSCLLKAESFEGAGVTFRTDRAGYSGSGYVDIPASQFYKITVRHRADSHKENPLLFNGKKALDIYSENGDWTETAVDGIFLEKGNNKITLGEGWSWIYSILIENGETLSDDIYSGVSEKLCNPNANEKTCRIYDYLRSIYGKRTLTSR